MYSCRWWLTAMLCIFNLPEGEQGDIYPALADGWGCEQWSSWQNKAIFFSVTAACVYDGLQPTKLAAWQATVLAYWFNWPQHLKWVSILKNVQSIFLSCAPAKALVNYSPWTSSSPRGSTTCPLGDITPEELQTAQTDLTKASQVVLPTWI